MKLSRQLLKEKVLLILDTHNEMLRLSHPNGQVEFLSNGKGEWEVSTYNHSMFLYTEGKHLIVEVVDETHS